MSVPSWLGLGKEAECTRRWRVVIESITYSEWRPRDWAEVEERKKKGKKSDATSTCEGVVDETLPPKSR